MKTVLIIEDSEGVQQMYSRQLQNKVRIIKAFDCKQAHSIISGKKLKDINAIILDGVIPSDKQSNPSANTETYYLAKKLAEKNFSGSIIAASDCSGIRAALVRSGCTHNASKETAIKKLLEILEI